MSLWIILKYFLERYCGDKEENFEVAKRRKNG